VGNWLKNNAKEVYTEEKRYYYTEEELLNFKNTAVKSGIEINNLSTLKAKVSKWLEEGTDKVEDDDDLTIDVPHTAGIKELKVRREMCEREVEKGYRSENVKIFGIPNQDDNTMNFFDSQGGIFDERTRALSMKEIREYFGIFANTTITFKQA
jgi:hypothetical protein